MMSDNDPTLELNEPQYNFLYRTMESFMRGYCSDSQKKEVEVKIEDMESIKENRAVLI